MKKYLDNAMMGRALNATDKYLALSGYFREDNIKALFQLREKLVQRIFWQDMAIQEAIREKFNKEREKDAKT